MMWEYQITPQADTDMNDMGRQGWELAGVERVEAEIAPHTYREPRTLLYWKRPREAV